MKNLKETDLYISVLMLKTHHKKTFLCKVGKREKSETSSSLYLYESRPQSECFRDTTRGVDTETNFKSFQKMTMKDIPTSLPIKCNKRAAPQQKMGRISYIFNM